ncbi:MAG: aldo/keto reductase [Clostridia bacterium]|nr:aldo/keto reductase [Clostridia bacterium]
MIYKDFQNLKLSALGMGTMRLPLKNGGYSDIDKAETEKMVEYALQNGINYFDTAWGYHDGQSETVIGKILEKYSRKSYMLATKFPGYDLSNMDKVQEIFEKQLEKCRVDYFDFYLVHNVCELNINDYLDPRHGIHDYLLSQKKNGRIRHLGFSAHGSYDVIERFLDAYGKDMEFCQLQINWIDWNFQNAKTKTELLRKWNLPIWVMEPLRGGKLTSLPDNYENELKSLRPNETVTEWSFRFLQSIPDVCVTLSGMSNFEQLKQNIKIFETEKALSDNEFNILLRMADEMTKKKSLSCTACRYCTSHCPQELDIPQLLSLYNEHIFTDGGFIAPMALAALPQDKQPSSCLGCRSCEAVCPQQIKISEVMSDFADKLKA